MSECGLIVEGPFFVAGENALCWVAVTSRRWRSPFEG
jgi:hypothetical protein